MRRIEEREGMSRRSARPSVRRDVGYFKNVNAGNKVIAFNSAGSYLLDQATSPLPLPLLVG